jgi:di/tricarboxylate transporter
MSSRPGPFGRPLWNFEVDPAWLALPVGVAGAGAVLVSAPLAAETARILAITVFCVSLWVGSPVDPWFTGLIGIGLIGAAFSTDLALVGFRSAATWLVVVGILLGEATTESGLGSLVERQTLRLVPARVAGDAAATYRYMLVTLSAAAFGLAVLIPSALVRVLVLGPILISVGDRFSDRAPKIGLFLGPVFVTYYGATGILTAALPNIVITGLAETGAGLSVSWVEWATLLGPVMGVGRSAAVVAVTYVLYRPAESWSVADPPDLDGSAGISADQRRMFLFLLAGVAVWATDTIHGLHPLFGALVVAVLAFAPRIGVVGPDTVGEADFSLIFFLGAIFAIAEGLQQTGFTDAAAAAILSVLPGDAGLAAVLAIVVVASMGLAFLMEGIAVASVLTPVLVSFAGSANIPLLPVIMTEAIALNTYFFPYQSAVMVAILGLDVVGTRELVRMATACTVVTLVVLLPVQLALFVLLF